MMAESWSSGGNLNTARFNYNLVKLLNGKILILGGLTAYGSDTPTSSCELFTPGADTWSITSNLWTARAYGGAVLLQNGKILAVGGHSGSTSLSCCELYDPTLGTWSSTGSLNTARHQFAIWFLTNGKVLVAGGKNNGIPISSAEIYDPATGTWLTTGSLAYSPVYPLFCTLGHKRPFIIGGTNGGSSAYNNAQTYDISSGIWTSQSNAPDRISGFMQNCCTETADGDALTVGHDFQDAPHIRAACYLFSHSSNAWSTVGDLPYSAEGSQVFLRYDRSIIQTCGSSDEASGSIAFSSKFNGSTWQAMPSLQAVRHWTNSQGPGIVLNDGRCILPGGLQNTSVVNTTYLYG